MKIDKIINELSYRLSDGLPNFSNPEHLRILEIVLTEGKWSKQAIAELVNNLTSINEIDGHKYSKRTGSPGNYKYEYPDGGGTKSGKSDTDATIDDKDNEEEPKNVVQPKQKTTSNLDPKKRIPNAAALAEMEHDAAEDSKRGKEVREMFTALETLKGNTKQTSLMLTALGQTYGRRDNTGMGKNNFGLADRDQLNLNKESLIKMYGDGSPKHIEKGVRAIRKHKVSEEFVRESYDTLPPKLKQYLKSAGDGGKNVGKGHFLGYKKSDGTTTSDVNDPDIAKGKDGKPEIVRGGVGNDARAKAVWRIYLEQGGVCAYTGLPLDIEAMDLEHVVGLNNKDNGDPKQHYDDRENDANFVITSSRANQKKSDKSMNEFYEKDVEPLSNKTTEDFATLEAGFDKANLLKPRSEQTAMRLMDDIQYDLVGTNDTMSKDEYDKLPDDKKPKLNRTPSGTPQNASANFGSNVTKKSLQAEFTFDEQEFETTRNTLMEKITDKKEARKEIAKIESSIGKRVINALGLPGNLAKESGRGTKGLNDNVYKGFALAMAGAPREEQAKYKEVWQEARALANKRDDKGNLLWGDKNGKNQKNEFIRHIRETGLIPKEVLANPDYKKLWSYKNEKGEVV